MEGHVRNPLRITEPESWEIHLPSTKLLLVAKVPDRGRCHPHRWRLLLATLHLCGAGYRAGDDHRVGHLPGSRQEHSLPILRRSHHDDVDLQLLAVHALGLGRQEQVYGWLRQ